MAQYILLVWERGDRRKRGQLNIRKCVQLVLVTALLLGFTNWFDGTTPGKLFEGAVYAWFQTLLADDGPLPVVVVDISDLDSQQVPNRPSPREQLRSLIDVIAKEGPPDAIGIDIDFSPDENGWTERGGPQLFDHLGERMTGGLPVYVGADRTRYGKSEKWLGDADYKDLAVMLALRKEDNRKMPLWIGDPDVCLAQVANAQAAKKVGKISPKAASGQGDCLFSMSAALALQYLNREDLGPCGWRCFAPSFERFTIDKALQIDTEFFVVDYGAVQRLVEQPRQAVLCGNHVLLARNPTSPTLRHRIVILGNTQWEATRDKYPIPPWQKEVPGVFFHASGVYTLIKGPLREITPGWRAVLDVLVVAMCVAVQQFVHRRFPRVEQDRVRWAAIWLVIVFVLALGSYYWLLRSERILWTDWPWISITLLLHGWLDRQLEQHDRMFQNMGRGLGSEERDGGVA